MGTVQSFRSVVLKIIEKEEEIENTYIRRTGH